jgi:hypothetical protein
MIKKINIIILFLFFMSCLIEGSVNNSTFNLIKERVELNKEEKIIIIFIGLSSCIKCGLLPLSSIEYASESLPDKCLNYKIIALVKCNREIELLRFKKLFQWEHYMMLNDGYMRVNLGLSKKTVMAIFDFEGNCLLNFDNLNKINSKKISKVLCK